jgi:D-alanyl-D-alanine carboxypeptidase/D-alanyl-D-alanine-endopeptidase (penicillin-binding protein 4)
VFLLLLATLGVAPPPTLAQRLDAVFDGPDYALARWGVLVVRADDGQIVHARSADQLFAPASVTKLYSCAAAFINLGPDKRHETHLYRRGDDLILVPGGDLTLGGRTRPDGHYAFADDDHTYASATGTDTALAGTAPLAGLEALVAKLDLKRVPGEVLIDDRLFEPGVGSGSGPRRVTPMIINDNLVDVVIRPGSKVGEPATFKLVPETAYISADVQVRTVGPKEPGVIRVEPIDARTFAVRGTIPLGSKPRVQVFAVGEPGRFARALLIEVLRRKGVRVDASALAAPKATLPERDWYNRPEAKPLATYTSGPLRETLKVTLKVSHNLYASTLPLLLREEGKPAPRTIPAGMRLQGEILRKFGVEVDRISLETGAGGGDGDRVSPRVTVQLLQKLYARKDWPAFEALLPRLGVDGTLANVLDPKSPARDRFYAKTGTYTDDNLLDGRTHLRAKSLAGSGTTVRGTKLLFCVFVNDVPLPRGVNSRREGRVLASVCDLLYRFGP